MKCTTFCLTAVLLGIAIVCPVQAALITNTRADTTTHTATTSPFFTQLNAGDGGGALAADNGWAPTAAAQASSAGLASVSTQKSYSIVGNATSVGGWTDGNGVPTGVTLSFNAAMTISVASPANGLLSHPAAAGIANGISITQVVGTGSGLEFANNESLAFSPINISGVTFSGSPSEPGYVLNGGNVSKFGIAGFRSGVPGGFVGAPPARAARVTLADASTIGFGDAGGTLASNLTMPNDHTQNFEALAMPFSRILQSFTYVAAKDSVPLKGMNFRYDISYDIKLIPEPFGLSLLTSGLLIGIAAFGRRRT